MKRFKFSKIKNWKRREIDEIKELINLKNNQELCEHFGVSLSILTNALQKHGIKREAAALAAVRAAAHTGEKNFNWKGGISKDGAHYSALQRQRYPERKHARDAVYRALKEGRLTKPATCQQCGKPCTPEGHHKSYEEDQWLKVDWLCGGCHRREDKRLWQDSTSKHK
jgi:hypothetical protein